MYVIKSSGITPKKLLELVALGEAELPNVHVPPGVPGLDMKSGQILQNDKTNKCCVFSNESMILFISDSLFISHVSHFAKNARHKKTLQLDGW